MVTKQFSADLHDKNDERGREAAKRLFKRWGLELKDNPDKYGVDLQAYKDGELYGNVEVEVREAWQGDFKFDTLNIPHRKRKFFEKDGRNCLVAFNSDLSQAFICDDWTVLFSNIEEVKNKYVENGEMFFKVPVNQIKLVQVYGTKSK